MFSFIGWLPLSLSVADLLLLSFCNKRLGSCSFDNVCECLCWGFADFQDPSTVTSCGFTCVVVVGVVVVVAMLSLPCYLGNAFLGTLS